MTSLEPVPVLRPGAGQEANPDGMAAVPEPGCELHRAPYMIRGDSLAPRLAPGVQLELAQGYYRCHPPRRGELVVFPWAGHPAPLGKVIAAVPGDRFEVRMLERSWRLLISGAPAVNSQGQRYFLDERARRLLQHLAESTDLTVPADALLVLGDKPQLTADSRRFGFIPLQSLLGRLDAP
ncbi:MAG: signal peptidase I [Myxococcota bacterium]|nr:signal peptidase I [Myxococcota bacterium]